MSDLYTLALLAMLFVLNIRTELLFFVLNSCCEHRIWQCPLDLSLFLCKVIKKQPQTFHSCLIVADLTQAAHIDKFLLLNPEVYIIFLSKLFFNVIKCVTTPIYLCVKLAEDNYLVSLKDFRNGNSVVFGRNEYKNTIHAYCHYKKWPLDMKQQEGNRPKTGNVFCSQNTRFGKLFCDPSPSPPANQVYVMDKNIGTTSLDHHLSNLSITPTLSLSPEHSHKMTAIVVPSLVYQTVVDAGSVRKLKRFRFLPEYDNILVKTVFDNAAHKCAPAKKKVKYFRLLRNFLFVTTTRP